MIRQFLLVLGLDVVCNAVHRVKNGRVLWLVITEGALPVGWVGVLHVGFPFLPASEEDGRGWAALGDAGVWANVFDEMFPIITCQ